MTNILQKIAEIFVRPAFTKLIGAGYIRSQLLRFFLALILAPFAVVVIIAVLFPESDKLTAFAITMFVILAIGILGFADQRESRTKREFKEHFLIIEVFEDQTLLDRAQDIEIIVRGAISDVKTSSNGEATWSYGEHQVGKNVLVMARRNATISSGQEHVLQKDSTHINLNLIAEKVIQSRYSEKRRPPFFRDR